MSLSIGKAIENVGGVTTLCPTRRVQAPTRRRAEVVWMPFLVPW